VTDGWSNRKNLIYLKHTNSRLREKIRQLVLRVKNFSAERREKNKDGLYNLVIVWYEGTKENPAHQWINI